MVGWFSFCGYRFLHYLLEDGHRAPLSGQAWSAPPALETTQRKHMLGFRGQALARELQDPRIRRAQERVGPHARPFLSMPPAPQP